MATSNGRVDKTAASTPSAIYGVFTRRRGVRTVRYTLVDNVEYVLFASTVGGCSLELFPIAPNHRTTKIGVMKTTVHIGEKERTRIMLTSPSLGSPHRQHAILGMLLCTSLSVGTFESWGTCGVRGPAMVALWLLLAIIDFLGTYNNATLQLACTQ